MKTTDSSVRCCADFSELFSKNTKKRKYDKADRDIYDLLVQFGDQVQAIKIAKTRYLASIHEYRYPSEMIACTTVHQLIEEIIMKTSNDDNTNP